MIEKMKLCGKLCLSVLLRAKQKARASTVMGPPCAHTHTYTHTHTQHSHIHTHARTHTYIHLLAHILVNTHTKHAHTLTHSNTHTHAHRWSAASWACGPAPLACLPVLLQPLRAFSPSLACWLCPQQTRPCSCLMCIVTVMWHCYRCVRVSVCV
jgi:hypothetical protein